ELVESEEGENAEHVAVAIGGEVIPRSAWNNTSLEDGMEIEIVKPIQGGC
ncbi:MAG: sulfur carrier protein ThiS, partial [bacterium]